MEHKNPINTNRPRTTRNYIACSIIGTTYYKVIIAIEIKSVHIFTASILKGLYYKSAFINLLLIFQFRLYYSSVSMTCRL